MTPEEAVKTALWTIAQVRGRVYPVEALKNAAAPFVFYERTTDDEDDALDGPTGLRSAAFRVHFVARSYAELLLICGSGRSALQAMQGTRTQDLLVERAHVRLASPDINETEMNLLRRVYTLDMDYQIDEEE